MAEPNSIKTPPPKTQQNPSKPMSNFLYKAIFVFVLIALLPLFPSSKSPELANKTILNTSWELLHLLLVGIAISYGLFSNRNSEPEIEKETQLKADTPQSYVSNILQVSSVFDDEELESPKGLNFPDETKNQTWKYSQYYREKPVVMVAEENTEGNNASTKPFFLPVRSLKSRSQYSEPLDSGYGNDEYSLKSKQTNEVGKNGKIGGGKEGAVLLSPIPWGSRSGRIEAKEESPTPTPYSLPNTAIYEELGSSKTPSFRSPPTPHSASRTPSPNKPSPTPSLSSEIRGKAKEDLGRKKSFYKYSPPPPPLPPPRPLRSVSHFVTERSDERKSFKDELEDLTTRGRRRFHNNDLGSNSFNSEKSSYTERSVTTVGSKEAQRLPPLPRNQSEKKNGFMEKMIITSDSESDDDDDDDDDSEISDVEEASNPVSVEAAPEENEVDKKADEFIAKFREQIRLQRIASIKKSSGQRTARSSK